MPISEKRLTIDRNVNPLRHTIDMGGTASANEAKISEICAALDKKQISTKLTDKDLGKTIRSMGYTISSKNIKAVKERRISNGLTYVPQTLNGSENEGRIESGLPSDYEADRVGSLGSEVPR
jgi:predicted DNA binding CopG/RHH family protein